MKDLVDYKKIEYLASNLLRSIWHNREELWPNKLHSYFDALDPVLACSRLGINYEQHQLLNDQFSEKGINYKVAGLIDRQSNKIVVSQDFSLEERRFTTAHELGHWLLHNDVVMHRDKPISNFNYKDIQRPLMEREADYFAACLLMPRKLVEKCINDNFALNTPIHINETISYWLSPDDPDSILRAEYDSLSREFAIARCSNFNSTPITPMAKLFKVSYKAMAIRIKKLNLIKWP